MPAVDQEETIAEATAQAYCNFRSVARRGKTDDITPSTLATYAVLRTKSNDHVGSSRESNNDGLSRRAQRLRGFKVLDAP